MGAPERIAYRQQIGIGKNAQVVLFVAMKVSETRKGFSYLQAALEKIKQAQPARPIEILVIGKSDPAVLQALPYPVHALGMLSKPAELVNAYSAADVFVIPSLEDNLPNTVMEALACGTPVAGFQTGGIPEMVGHLSEGYIAPQRNADELAKGILYLVDNQQDKSKNARQKALAAYSNPLIAARYISLYQRLLASR
jgi:glycosyltransferase involved in cell wall biosynthesis